MHFTLLLSTISFATLCSAQFQSFVTRPVDKAVNVTVLVNKNPNALAPGLFFVTPYVLGGQSFGPQIFTADGTAKANAFDSHVCNYLGATTLCYSDGNDVEQGGHSTGNDVFLNHGYVPAGPAISGTGGLRGPDDHELNTGSTGASLLNTVYQIRPYNLQPYGLPSTGYIQDGCFQDINLSDGKPLFQWCASDHLSLGESYVLPNNSPYIPGNNHEITHTNELGGDGSQTRPWDWFHINSVDRDTNGDYLISARHTSTVYKISGLKATYGIPGSIIWRLGGRYSSFSTNYNFSSQHMARFLQSNPTSAVISLFDDGTDGTYFSSTTSSGIIVNVEMTRYTSTLLNKYLSPVGTPSVSQGSMQVLPNNNALLGWGSQPYYSEFAQDGTLLYHALMGGLPGGGSYGQLSNYRAYKTEWLAAPVAAPDVVVYSSKCANSTVFAYASWNGATSVARWRFRGGPSNDPASWTTLATAGKAGFETGVVTQRGGTGKSTVLYIVADALNTDGRVLRSSSVVKTFVPGSGILCGTAACPDGTDYTTAPNSVSTCPT